MRIDRIELFHVEMPLKSPWRTAYGEDTSIHSILCRISSGSIDAWGESAPLAAPCYSPEWAGGAFQLARDWLAPAMVGRDIQPGADLQKRLAIFRGNPFAKAALDNARWSLESKRTGQPLHLLLGASRDRVPVGADFGVADEIDELLQSVEQAVEDGFGRVKLKFRPGWDLPIVEAVRHRFPSLVFHIDCNSGYCLDELPLFRELDAFDLAMIEQPLAHDDLIDHASLQCQIKTPICLDESIVSLRKARQAIALGSCRFINIKPGRVGGLTNAVAIHDACQAANIPCWVGGMLESAVGASQCAALAMLDNFTYPADIFPSNRFYETDLADPPLILSTGDDGQTPSVDAPTVLPEPNQQRLRLQTVQRAVVE